MTKGELLMLQSLPLEIKVEKTKLRIKEWYEYWQGDVYVSFSGGKDSTVLLDIARNIYPDIEAVFVDTGLEYPELKEFVKTIPNITIVKPKMSFRQVIEKYGYPIISKEIANVIEGAKRNPNSTRMKRLQGELTNKDGNKSIFNCEKYKYLLNAPFKCSDKCCSVMKKTPAKLYEKENGKKPILGLMANESQKRHRDYLKTGCNAFNKGRPQSQPMGFWTEQDILKYLKDYNVPYAPVYGDIVEIDGKLTTTGEKRTGCMFCAFGVHLEKEPNRFQRMKETHPKIYDYCMREWEKGGLGMDQVLDYIKVKH